MRKIGKILSAFCNYLLIGITICLLLPSCTSKKQENHKYALAKTKNSDSLECILLLNSLTRLRADTFPAKTKYIPGNIQESIA
jgi:hypothetical protein